MPMGSYEIAEKYERERELRKNLLHPHPEKEKWTWQERVMLAFLVASLTIVISLALWGHKFCLWFEAI